jgi:multiple sugar transport system ATP-binding protein
MMGGAIDEDKLELRDLRKSFDGVEAVKGSNLVVHRGEFLSLLGPSGCGKSTTLAMIAGFVDPTSGQILVDGERVNDIPPQKRRIGLVFQDYAIFTRLTVRRNLYFGLEAQNVPRSERNARVDDIVAKLNLSSVQDVRGGDLNMSEMQRVALARVLVTQPALLLLDEPMSNLDSALRESLRRELKEIQQTLNQTVLYVTHDQLEAMAMSDRIAIMNQGEILQVGSPEEIYHRPVSRFVAEFIGDPPINILACEVTCHDKSRVFSTSVHQNVDLPGHGATGNYLLGIRPQHVEASREPFAQSVPVTVELVEFLGSECVLHVTYGGELLRALVAPGFAEEGDTVHVALDMQYAHLIDPDTGLVVAPKETVTTP